ncbi:MAG: hypothetical protein ACRDHW_07280 [Ktedonobacteraceae bacterium]
MSDIFQQLEIGAIPGMADFLSEPASGLDNVPISQRVQCLLADLFGAAWAGAGICSWTLPNGQQAHIAFGPPPEVGQSGVAMHMVAENQDGELALAAPLPNGNDDPDVGTPEMDRESQPWTARDEELCMSEILPALREINTILAQSETLMRPRKERLREQLDHAVSHLKMNMEMWRKGEEPSRQEGDAQ